LPPWARGRYSKDDCLMLTGDNPPELPGVSPIRQRLGRIWPLAIIALGIAFTAVWISVLLYGLVKLVELMI